MQIPESGSGRENRESKGKKDFSGRRTKLRQNVTPERNLGARDFRRGDLFSASRRDAAHFLKKSCSFTVCMHHPKRGTRFRRGNYFAKRIATRKALESVLLHGVSPFEEAQAAAGSEGTNEDTYVRVHLRIVRPAVHSGETFLSKPSLRGMGQTTFLTA